MRHDLSVSGSIDISASPTKVWDALTNPDIIKEYLFGAETITDWRIGSSIIFQGNYQGQPYKDKGVVRENIPLRLLSYDYWSGFTGLEDKPENYSLVTYTLASTDDQSTNLTWTMKGFANEEGYQHSKAGMGDFLLQIKAIIER